MPFRMKTWIYLLCFPLTLATANIRAPVLVPQYETKIVSPQAEGITVLREELNFDCPELFQGNSEYATMLSMTCGANIRYFIKNIKAQRLLLRFVFSGGGDVAWKIDESSQVIKKSDHEAGAKQLNCRWCDSKEIKLFQSEHSFLIPEGEHQIQIQYQQKLSFLEVEYGYSKKSQWSQSFTYETWPLKEWKIDHKFTLRLTIKTPLDKTSPGQSERALDARCYQNQSESSKLEEIPFKSIKQENHSIATFVLHTIPHQINCSYAQDLKNGRRFK